MTGCAWTEEGLLPPWSPLLKEAAEELDLYFRGGRKSFFLPLRAEGTPFQQDIWKAIAQLPWGETLSYGELAAAAGHSGAARAAGQACRKNPLVIFIPCHRITAAHGFGGYNGGLERKRLLWQVEHISLI